METKLRAHERSDRPTFMYSPVSRAMIVCLTSVGLSLSPDSVTGRDRPHRHGVSSKGPCHSCHTAHCMAGGNERRFGETYYFVRLCYDAFVWLPRRHYMCTCVYVCVRCVSACVHAYVCTYIRTGNICF